MGRTANLSVLGLYSWDSTLFSLFEVPEGIDIDILRDNILAELCELEVLYPNPVVLKNLIGIWSKKQKPIWEKLLATTEFEYDPIENYNRTETGSDSGSKNGGTGGHDTTSNSSGIINGGSDTNLHKIASFDSTDLISQTSDTTTYGKTENSSGSSTTTYGKTETETSSGSHTLHAHGNIGVTTTQNMIKQEREVDKFNIYDYIINDFKMRFCILVY